MHLFHSILRTPKAGRGALRRISRRPFGAGLRGKSGAGFTLIETFVAIVILATALAGTLSLASQGFNSADVAGDQITASFLAQDAIEYVLFARDSGSWVSGGSNTDWLANLRNCVSANGNKTCFLDSSLALAASNPKQCPSNSCPPLDFDPTSGFYNYAGNGTDDIPNQVVSASNAVSKFTRTIAITSPVNGQNDEAHVQVTVQWVARGGAPHAPVVLEKDIYNW